MNKIYVYNIVNLIPELSHMRYNIVGKEEFHEDFIMTGKIGDNVIIASKLSYKKVAKKLKEAFAGGEFILFDITESISDQTFVIDTSDNDIARLKRLFTDVSKANDIYDKDKAYFGASDDNSDTDDRVDIPTMDELLDKISESGMDSLNNFEKKLLEDYSK